MSWCSGSAISPAESSQSGILIPHFYRICTLWHNKWFLCLRKGPINKRTTGVCVCVCGGETKHGDWPNSPLLIHQGRLLIQLLNPEQTKRRQCACHGPGHFSYIYCLVITLHNFIICHLIVEAHSSLLKRIHTGMTV
ncbi:hypothetical protein ILYODFUR_001751 [Ilyodon furcidens]|uniref:Uncharacterized protein n=1 Tax=Ilyodon furcidens TaxID=33524 RepID=A0ABV0SV81_9TELE